MNTCLSFPNYRHDSKSVQELYSTRATSPVPSGESATIRELAEYRLVKRRGKQPGWRECDGLKKFNALRFFRDMATS